MESPINSEPYERFYEPEVTPVAQGFAGCPQRIDFDPNPAHLGLTLTQIERRSLQKMKEKSSGQDLPSEPVTDHGKDDMADHETVISFLKLLEMLGFTISLPVFGQPEVTQQVDHEKGTINVHTTFPIVTPAQIVPIPGHNPHPAGLAFLCAILKGEDPGVLAQAIRKST